MEDGQVRKGGGVYMAYITSNIYHEDVCSTKEPDCSMPLKSELVRAMECMYYTRSNGDMKARIRKPIIQIDR